MVVVVQISDFHLGHWSYQEELLENAIDEINEQDPDVTVVTGDITQNGYHMEFEKAAYHLSNIKSPLLVVPGNHDARHVGNEMFEELVKNRFSTLTLQNKEVKIIGLDSSEPDLNYGKVGRAQQKWMEKELKNCENSEIYKIIALHHHIIPVPKTGRERNVLTDAGDILQSVIEGGANLVLSGHKHMPYVWLFGNTGFITAGTVSSLKLRGNNLPSYNIIDINDEHIKVTLRDSEGNERVLEKYENKACNY